LALLALDIKPGDEVITVPMTFVATAAAVDYAGGRTRLVDVDPHTWTLDPNRLESAITPRTRAILPVHLHGLSAPMDAIRNIADKHGLAVLEDAAQAHGATCDGKRVGENGHAACYSFYPGKNLGAAGEGGAVVTDDPAIAQKVRQLRDWGATRKYHHELKGFNYRLEGMQGAVLRVKLRHLAAWNESRRKHAHHYLRRLARAGIGLPAAPEGSRHVYHVFAIRVPNRDALQEKLRLAGISTNIHYPIPVHLQPAFADLGYHAGDFPVSEQLGKEFLSLPMYPELTTQQVDQVCDALLAAL